tara:strand:- start:1908 stop:2525 length:618 start_codon:yes stop_codon:yes gene_type:complete
MSWLTENAQAISAAASVGSLVIWSVYLSIFWRGYRRQLKPKLVINRGEGEGLDAHCLLTNMSQQSIHIQGVKAALHFADESCSGYITDAEDVRAAGNPQGWQRLTRQVPLASGAMMDMGTFHSIFAYVVRNAESKAGASIHRARRCGITVLAIYGSEDLLVGATREFDVVHGDDSILLASDTVETRQLTSRRERRRLSRDLAAGA